MDALINDLEDNKDNNKLIRNVFITGILLPFFTLIVTLLIVGYDLFKSEKRRDSDSENKSKFQKITNLADISKLKRRLSQFDPKEQEKQYKKDLQQYELIVGDLNRKIKKLEKEKQKKVNELKKNEKELKKLLKLMENNLPDQDSKLNNQLIEKDKKIKELEKQINNIYSNIDNCVVKFQSKIDKYRQNNIKFGATGFNSFGEINDNDEFEIGKVEIFFGTLGLLLGNPISIIVFSFLIVVMSKTNDTIKDIDDILEKLEKNIIVSKEEIESLNKFQKTTKKWSEVMSGILIAVLTISLFGRFFRLFFLNSEDGDEKYYGENHDKMKETLFLINLDIFVLSIVLLVIYIAAHMSSKKIKDNLELPPNSVQVPTPTPMIP